MSQTERPVPGQRYRHFRGNLYQIITLGFHTETNEEMVVYQALYGEFKVYIRPLDMFLERIDKEQYPEAEQEYRFQLVDTDRLSLSSDETEQEIISVEEEENQKINPLLLQFLDAETYGEKLKIFLEMRDTIDEVVLTDVAASMDISTGTGSLEEQYASVQFALHTLAKYERNKR